MAVANPGGQTAVTGTAITTLSNSATDTQSGATLTWSATGLPSGLSINPSTGSVTGTPTAPCSCSVTVVATDGAGFSGTASFAWTVTNTVVVAPQADTSSPSGTAVAPLTNSATDSQSGSTLTWSATGLPVGLSIDPASGTVTGTPTTGGVFPVVVTATDGSGFSDSTSFSWTVTNTVVISGPGDQTAPSGTAVSPVPVTATDTSSTATISFSATGLPVGLSIDPTTGTISGTPTTACSCSVTVTAADGSGASDSTTFTWTITNAVVISGPGDQTDVSGSSITPVTTGATDGSSTATISFSATGLPVGLSIDPTTGTISGTPTTACSCSVTVTATDSSAASSSTTFTWTITNVITTPAIGDQSSDSGTPITPLGLGSTDSSSTATIAYADGGSLPPGLAIDPVSGSITGTPTTAGTYPVTITATDSAGFSATASFNWTVTNVVSETAHG